MTGSDRKRKVRERMARTGENYTTALRAIQEERMSLNPPHGAGYWPAVTGQGERDRLRDKNWTLWAGQYNEPDHPDRHQHQAPDGREFSHRHQGGAEPHDHRPANPS